MIWDQIQVVIGFGDFQLLTDEYLTLDVLYHPRPEIGNQHFIQSFTIHKTLVKPMCMYIHKVVYIKQNKHTLMLMGGHFKSASLMSRRARPSM